MPDNQTTQPAIQVWHDPRQFEERFLTGVLTLFSQTFQPLDYYWTHLPNSDPASCVIRLRRSAGSYPTDDDMRFYGALWS